MKPLKYDNIALFLFKTVWPNTVLFKHLKLLEGWEALPNYKEVHLTLPKRTFSPRVMNDGYARERETAG